MANTINASNFGTGTSGQVLTSNGAGVAPTFQAAGGGSGSNLTLAVSQMTHGFSVGSVVYYNGTAYAAAKADTAAHAEVVGIVSAVADANDFTLLMSGAITTLSGLTAGVVYFLDPSTAGNYTATEPTTVGQIQKALMVAYSTTAAFFFNYLGKIIPSPGTAITWNTAASTPITLTAYSGWSVNNSSTQVVFDVPASPAVGDTYQIMGYSSGGWQVQMNTSQYCNVGASQTSMAGTVTSQNQYDCIIMVCVAANNFTAISMGNLTTS